VDVCGNWDLNFAGCCTVLPRCHIERPKNTKRNTVLCFSLLAVLWPLVCQSHDRPALLRTGELENASRCGDPSRRCRCQSHNRPALLQTGELEEACGDPSCCRCCQSHDRPAFLRIGELEEAYGDPSCCRSCQSHDRPAFLRIGELEEACGDPSCCARGNHPMAHPESWGDAWINWSLSISSLSSCSLSATGRIE
jgi:hypothetical protein